MQMQTPHLFEKLIPDANGYLFAIAQDGIAWVVYANATKWIQIPPLPPLEYRAEAVTT